MASAIESKNRKISDLRGIAIEGWGDETQATRAGFNLVGEEGILRAANYLLREAASGAQAESGVQPESAAREEGRAERDVSTAQADRVTAKIAEYVKKVEIMNREIQAVNSHRETNQSIKFPEGELAGLSPGEISQVKVFWMGERQDLIVANVMDYLEDTGGTQTASDYIEGLARSGVDLVSKKTLIRMRTAIKKKKDQIKKN